ncbi:MAG: hypothetical protein DWQ18_06150 [Crenarchaeota archaeon]|nr:MAG: hypothetical protein DWQ17_06985 [Thermoproteota archaeon]RDJ33619.1 MAG: hypothetical protein DWQ18_06150 [Thermoproteota archaeon]RDJ38059.1 MAG: hypothetical protein DWQ19_01025 [Thermoproteota archaeon]RDJ39172.1 MAG: hypothetical protein DWQ13_02645 [Thermoproteota archaeon]
MLNSSFEFFPFMKKAISIGIIVAAVAVGIGLASPLFYERQIDEPLPVALNKIEEGLTLEKFTNMEDSAQESLVQKMPEKTKAMIMEEMAKTESQVSEEMSDDSVSVLKTGEFEGLVGHKAMGTAKTIMVGDATYLRFENFEVTNGPDLRVYLTPGGDVKQGIHLEKLKGSKGDQNYLLEGIDTDTYDTVVIYCQPFGVYFGQAMLS